MTIADLISGGLTISSDALTALTITTTNGGSATLGVVKDIDSSSSTYNQQIWTARLDAAYYGLEALSASGSTAYTNYSGATNDVADLHGAISDARNAFYTDGVAAGVSDSDLASISEYGMGSYTGTGSASLSEGLDYANSVIAANIDAIKTYYTNNPTNANAFKLAVLQTVFNKLDTTDALVPVVTKVYPNATSIAKVSPEVEANAVQIAQAYGDVVYDPMALDLINKKLEFLTCS